LCATLADGDLNARRHPQKSSNMKNSGHYDEYCHFKRFAAAGPSQSGIAPD
jgi:hypothetical protein